MMVKNPKVSVILPFYVTDEKFGPAIDSIIRQSYTEWELLLVNNNGPTETTRLARSYCQKDSRIIQLFEKQQGIAHALNTGLKQSRGKYIARMDADDLSFPDRLALQATFLDNTPEIGVVSSQTTFVSEVERSDGYALFVDWQNSLLSVEDHFLSRFVESPIAHPSVMFRRELIDRLGYYSTANEPEDYELWLRWFDQGVTFQKLPQALLQWNDHNVRLSRLHSNYSREAFFNVKCRYLAKWINKALPSGKKIVVCGSSKIGRKRADLLLQLGIPVHGFTDVRCNPNKTLNFFPLESITDPGEWLLINFISKRGVGQSIREHFTGLGFCEGRDFVLAG